MNGPHLPEIDVLQVVGRLLIRRRSSGGAQSHDPRWAVRLIRRGLADRHSTSKQNLQQKRTRNNILYQIFDLVAFYPIFISRLQTYKWLPSVKVAPSWLRRSAKGLREDKTDLSILQLLGTSSVCSEASPLIVCTKITAI